MFLDERGQRVPGNWPDSPKPTEHDILTGSTADGTVMAGKTCNDWTSAASDQQAQVGHRDGLGPGGDPSGRYAIWNSSHRMEVAPIRLRAEEQGEFTASRRNESSRITRSLISLSAVKKAASPLSSAAARDIRVSCQLGLPCAFWVTEPKSITQSSDERHQDCVFGRNSRRWRIVPTRRLNVWGSISAAA